MLPAEFATIRIAGRFQARPTCTDAKHHRVYTKLSHGSSVECRKEKKREDIQQSASDAAVR